MIRQQGPREHVAPRKSAIVSLSFYTSTHTTCLFPPLLTYPKKNIRTMIKPFRRRFYSTWVSGYTSLYELEQHSQQKGSFIQEGAPPARCAPFWNTRHLCDLLSQALPVSGSLLYSRDRAERPFDLLFKCLVLLRNTCHTCSVCSVSSSPGVRGP